MAKRNGYIVAILAGIFALISLLTPASYWPYAFGEYFRWMWGLYLHDPNWGDSNWELLDYDNHSDYYTYGLIATLLLSISMIILFYTAYKANKKSGDNRAVWVICGVLLIASSVIYIIGCDVYQNNYWDPWDPHFGVIGPFIAAALAFIAAYIK